MGGVARYLSRYITWIEVSVSMGDLEGGGAQWCVGTLKVCGDGVTCFRKWFDL